MNIPRVLYKITNAEFCPFNTLVHRTSLSPLFFARTSKNSLIDEDFVQISCKDCPRPNIEETSNYAEAAALSSFFKNAPRPNKPLKVVIAGAGAQKYPTFLPVVHIYRFCFSIKHKNVGNCYVPILNLFF